MAERKEVSMEKKKSEFVEEDIKCHRDLKLY